MSLLLLENGNWNNGSGIPNGSGLFTAGSYNCSSGKGSLTFGNAGYNYPAYSASNISGASGSTGLLEVRFQDSLNEGLSLTAPSIATLGGTLAAGIGYKFRLYVTRLTPFWQLLLDSQSVFVWYNNTSQAQIGDGVRNQTLVRQALPAFNQSALGAIDANSSAQTQQRIDVTIYIRSYNAGTAVVETWVDYPGLSRYPVRISQQTLTLTSGVMLFKLYDLSGYMGAANVTCIAHVEIASGGDLDPTLSKPFLGLVGFGKIQFGDDNSSVVMHRIVSAKDAASGTILALAADQLGDGWLAASRLMQSIDNGVTFAETQFSGTDGYGNASTSLALFDNDAAHVYPAIGLTRTLNTTPPTTNLGQTSTAGASNDTFYNLVCVPFTPTVNGTVNSISLYNGTSLQSTQATLMEFAIYDSDGAGGKPGTRLAVTAAGGPQTAAGWLTLNISGGYAVTAGHTYWMAFGPSSGNFGIGRVAGSGAVYLSDTSKYPPATAGTATAYNYLPIAYVTMAGAAAFATAAVQYNHNSNVTVTLTDSSDAVNFPKTFTFSGGTITTAVGTMNAWFAANATAWSAMVLPNKWSSVPGNAGVIQLQPTVSGSPIDCNGKPPGYGTYNGTINAAMMAFNQAIGIDPGSGNALAVCQRTIEPNTTFLTGRFGTRGSSAPYYAANWGPEFTIHGQSMTAAGTFTLIGRSGTSEDTYSASGTYNGATRYYDSVNAYYCAWWTPSPGVLPETWSILNTDPNSAILANVVFLGPATGTIASGPAGQYTASGKPGAVLVPNYTAGTGGDQINPGDVRTVLKLGSGQWAVSFDWANQSGSTWNNYPSNYSGYSVLLSNSGQSDSQIAAAAAFGSAGASWSESVIQSVSGINQGGTEPSICQLSNSKILCVARQYGGALMSLGTLSGNTITWVDPTYTGNSAKYCVCDGGVNTNNNQRPALHCGNTPVYCASDTINALVYFTSSSREGTYQSQPRGLTQVFQCSESSILGGSFRLSKAPQGDLFVGNGGVGNSGYDAYYVSQQQLQGTCGAWFFSGYTAAAASGGGGTGRLGLGI